MSLIKCPECGREVSDKARACPHCGFAVSEAVQEGKVVVYGYTQYSIVNPSITILVNGRPKGTVPKGGFLEIAIDETSEVTFKCGIRSASITAPSGKVTKVKIAWDRATGKIIPQIIDVMTPTDSFL